MFFCAMIWVGTSCSSSACCQFTSVLQDNGLIRVFRFLNFNTTFFNLTFPFSFPAFSSATSRLFSFRNVGGSLHRMDHGSARCRGKERYFGVRRRRTFGQCQGTDEDILHRRAQNSLIRGLCVRVCIYVCRVCELWTFMLWICVSVISSNSADTFGQ